MINFLQRLSPIQKIIGLFVLSSIAPIIHYPLTDGDIAHWVGWAHDISQHFNFLGSESDQSHGPFLAWSTGVMMALFGTNYLVINSVNLLCGCGLIYFIYLFGKNILKSDQIAQLAAVMASANIVFVYLNRTPMYDWPATLGFFGFCYFFLRRNDIKYGFYWALLFYVVGALNRLAIVSGLSGFFVILSIFSSSGISIKNILQIIKIGIIMAVAAGIAYTPWVITQHDLYPYTFMEQFQIDNFFRFFKDQPHDEARYDFYGFILYAIVGALPFTPILFSHIKRCNAHVVSQPMVRQILWTTLPCLLIFSLSGHTKLLRYIAYAFPGLILYVSVIFHSFYNDSQFIRKLNKVYIGFWVFFILLLCQQAIQFSTETSTNMGFTFIIIFLVLSLLGIAHWGTCSKNQPLLSSPIRWLFYISIIYIISFSSIGALYDSTDFLQVVDKSIQSKLIK